MPDFVRHHLDRKIFESLLTHLLQIDDDALIPQADHREASIETLRGRFFGCQAKTRRAKLQVAAPSLQRARPCVQPLVPNRFERGLHQPNAMNASEWVCVDVTAIVEPDTAMLVIGPAMGNGKVKG